MRRSYNLKRGGENMSVSKQSFAVLILLCLIFALLSCSSNERIYPLEPVESGFLETTGRGGDESFPSAVRCGYKIKKNQFEENTNIPITLYYGIDTSRRKNENNVPGQFEISFYRNDSKAITLKKHTLKEMFSGEYDVEETMGEKLDNVHRYIHISFTHCENVEVPSYMFEGNEGAITVGIYHKTNDARYGYGYDVEFICYKKINGIIYLASSLEYFNQ